jgi:Intracellular proteinase inhibitor
MSRAVLPLVLLLAAVPAASASRPGGEIPHCKTLLSEVPPSDRSARPQDLELSVRYTLETVLPAGQRVRWILNLRNRTSRALRLSFPSSRYANVVLRRGGRVVYSWSYRRFFLDVVTARRLGARATYVCSLGPDLLDLEPGRYEVVAYLSSMMRAETRRSLVVPGWRDHWRRR